MKTLLDFMKRRFLYDGNLRDLIDRGLLFPALKECDDSIRRRYKEIDDINQLKEMILAKTVEIKN